MFNKVCFYSVALSVTIVSNLAHAQATMSSTAELKRACETSVGNRVVIASSTDIKYGTSVYTRPAHIDTANSNCTIVLAPSASLKFDGVAMNFLGALNIVTSATGNQLEFDHSNIHANSITLNMAGDGSSLFIKEAEVKALAGNTSVTFGHNAKLLMSGKYGRLLEASNIVRLTAGNKFSAEMSRGYIWGDNGVNINLTGEETVYKFNEFNTHAQPGKVSFRASGAKTLFEFGSGSIWGYSGITLTMSGVENQLVTSGAAFNTYTGAGVRLAVGNNQAKGTIKMSQTRFGGAGGLVIEAGKGGSEGMIEFTQGSVIGMSATGVRIETGTGGNTIVKDSSLQPYYAPITIKGPGFCLAENNVISATAQYLCL